MLSWLYVVVCFSVVCLIIVDVLMCVSLSLSIYIYIYIYTHTHIFMHTFRCCCLQQQRAGAVVGQERVGLAHPLEALLRLAIVWYGMVRYGIISIV